METEAGTVKAISSALRRRLRGRLRAGAPALPLRGRWKRWQRDHVPRRLILLLSIIGPGIITANVDNDAGGIATYSLAGANFGYGLFWVLIPITLALVVVQEMCSRMGIVTGKGLADLIREQYGVKATFYVMVALLLANLANTVAEFAGVAASLEIFGVSKYVSIPAAALFVWWLIVYGTYRRVERVFLIACFFYVAYLISGVMAQPPWGTVLARMVVPEVQWNSRYLVMLVGVVGTTIAPWMQFYQQSAVVEKGIRPSQYRYARYDTMVGCFIAVVVAMFIMVACAATLHERGIAIETAKDAALALQPLAGRYCAGLFAFGLFNASLFAASVLPLATAYYVCEGLGWETGIDKKLRDAPQFFGLYTALIVVGSLFILIPGFPLLAVMYLSQVLNGVLLPFVLVFILLLINRRDLMGQYVNTPLFNAVAWSTSIIMIGLTLVMVGSLLLGY
ncbi:MAG: Nramp family divalent metal transporter [Deltaproteobacteria bacterium]|nr:Nramp family divalent metal transporter [Deltaproteobacteria bacterium]